MATTKNYYHRSAALRLAEAGISLDEYGCITDERTFSTRVIAAVHPNCSKQSLLRLATFDFGFGRCLIQDVFYGSKWRRWHRR
eukprot:scaffold1803_cov92-Amphora_coffeaeformis.AAC.90